MSASSSRSKSSKPPLYERFPRIIKKGEKAPVAELPMMSRKPVDKEPKIRPDGPPLLEGVVIDIIVKKSKEGVYMTSQEIAVHIFGLRGRASIVNPTIYRLAKRGLLVKRQNPDGSARPCWSTVDNIEHIGFIIDLRSRILRQLKSHETSTMTKTELFQGLSDKTIPREIFEEAFQQIVLHGRLEERKIENAESQYTLLPPKRKTIPQTLINDIQILLDRNVQGLTLSQLLVLLDPAPEDNVDIGKLGRVLHLMMHRKMVIKHQVPGRKYPIWKINSPQE